MENLNKYFDHTVLKPDAVKSEIISACIQAKVHEFAAVCVNPYHLPTIVAELKGTDVKKCIVVGFPLGACSTDIKVAETKLAVEQGADEIDMVINIGALKEDKIMYVIEEIRAIVSACGEKAIVKVIIEACLLNNNQIIKACELAEAGGAAFVKTSTGFSNGGATVEAVALMKKTVGDRLKIKASGGIKDLKTTLAMIEAGADRIGASSSSNILEESKNS